MMDWVCCFWEVCVLLEWDLFVLWRCYKYFGIGYEGWRETGFFTKLRIHQFWVDCESWILECLSDCFLNGMSLEFSSDISLRVLWEVFRNFWWLVVWKDFVRREILWSTSFCFACESGLRFWFLYGSCQPKLILNRIVGGFLIFHKAAWFTLSLGGGEIDLWMERGLKIR